MTDREKEELDRWLSRIGGQVNTWSAPDGRARIEARVWKNGGVRRFITAADRWTAIRELRACCETPEPAAAPKIRCASCPQPAAEEFKILVCEASAALAGLVVSGPIVDYDWAGVPIHEETVALCPRCMAVEIRRFLKLCRDPAEWLKLVRA